MKYVVSILLLTILMACSPTGEKILPYQDASVSPDKRTEDLLSRMTLEEKFWQMFMIPGDLSDGKDRYQHGIFGFQVATKARSANEAEQMLDYSGGTMARETAEKINAIQRYFVEETRLGIPIIPFDEALHGLVRPGATAFPQSIALAATFDTTLVAAVAQAIAMETKTRGIRQILSPVVNIARDVRWGRTEETYGEDPYLTTRMGVAFMQSFEKLGVITTPKHFVANVGDGGRDSYPIHFNERLMEEIYYPAFKAAFHEAGAQSVMTAYNSYDGRPCTASDRLLNKKLKEEWGFQGFVISDAGATGGANVLHFTTQNYAESTADAIENGLDVIFQTSWDHYPLFFEAYEKGMVDEEAMNEAVRRVLYAKFTLGLFENPYVDPEEASRWNGRTEHRQLAEDAAVKSMVLLKNDHQVLPVSQSVRSLAIIGTDALEARLGGYAGPGNQPVSLLEGIRSYERENLTIRYEPGPGRDHQTHHPIPAEYFFHLEGEQPKPGLKASYFNNTHVSGTPDLERIDSHIDFRWTLFSPDPSVIHYDYYSVRWTGKLIAPGTGTWDIGFYGDEGYRLYINDELVLDRWFKRSVTTATVPYRFQKDKIYDIRAEFYETTGNVWLKMIWNHGVDDTHQQDIQRAVRAARQSDLALVVAGIEEGEFRDRASLNLPGKQEDLIRAVAAAGTPVVVILIGGSAVDMSSWLDQADGVLMAWYPGEAGGHALARILFGESAPAGRLPLTFPLDEAQLPLYYNHKPTGRGDDYLNLSGKPLFPFGYGLSYTRFSYSNLHVSQDTIQAGQHLTLTFDLENTGDFDGDEVVQLYLKDLYASVVRPVYELKGFRRIHLKKGEKETITMVLPASAMEMLNEAMERVIEPGTFRIMIGSSSNQIHLRREFVVLATE